MNKTSYIFCLLLFTNLSFAQTPISPGVTVSATMDEAAYGFILCETTGFGDNDETKTYEYTAPSDLPCSNIMLTNITNVFTGIFIYEDNLPTSSTDPCVGKATNAFSTSDLTANFNMIAGKTYYFIVTNYDESGTLGFDILLTSGTSLPASSIVLNHVTDGTTVELADGATANFYDSGGPNCDYTEDQDYTITVCPDAAAAAADQIVQLEFTAFDINNTCEFNTSLRLYRGTTTNPSNEIPVDGKYLNQDFNFDVRIFTAITTGGCMTVSFENPTIAGACEGTGWEGNFSLLDNPCTTTTMSDECADAPMLIFGESLYSTTECFTGDLSTCGFGFQNDGWFKAVADGTVMEITYEITGGNACYDGDGGTTDETPDDELGAGVQLILNSSCSGLDADAFCADKKITGGIDATNGEYASGVWTITGLTDGATYYARFDGLGSDLCNFSVMGTGVALPVELISFKAFEQERSNLLEWRTATEENTAYHIIERSSDGKTFEEIGKVRAAGTSVEPLHYNFVDEQPLLENYYRLKSLDFDETYGYSSTIFVKRNPKGVSIQSIYPNPTTGLINIETHSDFSGEVVLSLRSMIGKLVQTKTVSLVKGEQVQELDLSGVPAGIYFVQLAGETSNSMYKVVKR